MVRPLGTSEIRGLRILVPHDRPLPHDIKERSFRVKRAYIGTQVTLDEKQLVELTKKYETAKEKTALADWKKMIGYESTEVEVEVGEGGKKAVQKKAAVSVKRKELRFDFIMFRRWKTWFKVLVPAPFSSVAIDTGKGRGDRVILMGYFDPKPISKVVRVPKKAWLESSTASFKRMYGKDPSRTEVKRFEREYDVLPKGVTERLYFMPLHPPEYIQEVGAAAAAHAINEAGLVGLEQFGQQMARLPGTEAALKATIVERDELRKQVAQTQTALGDSMNLLHEARRLLKEKGVNFQPPLIGPGQVSLTGGSSALVQQGDESQTRPKHKMNLGFIAPLFGVILVLSGIGVAYYGATLTPPSVTGWGTMIAGLLILATGGAVAYFKRPGRNPSTQPSVPQVGASAN